jgi:hypothetical protein
MIGKGRRTNASDNPLLFSKFKDSSGIGGEGRSIKQYIQNDIGVNECFHFRYFASRSSRISSRLISPREVCNTHKANIA